MENLTNNKMKAIKFSKKETLRLLSMIHYEIDNLTRDLDFTDSGIRKESILNRINELNIIRGKLNH